MNTEEHRVIGRVNSRYGSLLRTERAPVQSPRVNAYDDEAERWRNAPYLAGAYGRVKHRRGNP